MDDVKGIENCGMRISDCGFKIAERLFSNPHSAIRKPQSKG